MTDAIASNARASRLTGAWRYFFDESGNSGDLTKPGASFHAKPRAN